MSKKSLVGYGGLLIILLAILLIYISRDDKSESEQAFDSRKEVVKKGRADNLVLEETDLELGYKLIEEYGEENPLKVARGLKEREGLIEALSYLAAIQEVHGQETNIGVLVQRASFYIDKGALKLAKSKINKVFEEVEYDEWASRLLAQIYLKQDEVELALEVLEGTINSPESDPQDQAFAYIEISNIYEDQGKISKSIEAVNNAIELTPEVDWYHERLKRLTDKLD